MIKDIPKQLNDTHPPCYNALYKWIKIYKESDLDQFSLLKSKSLPRGAQIEAEVVEITDQCIKDHYLNTNCVSQQHIFAFIDAQIIVINRNRPAYSSHLLMRPCKSTVRRRIKKLCQYDTDLKRHGRAYAKKKHHFSRIFPSRVRYCFSQK